MRVGVEVGGTFTDLVAFKDGGIIVAKAPSTPQSPDVGAFNVLAGTGVDLRHIGDLVHGSTVATNAILERKGARIALLVTKGARDVLYLQRHNRRDIYALNYRKPAPIVKRRDTYEICERIGADGVIIDDLDTQQASEVIDTCFSKGYDGFAICLLNAYANTGHEDRLRELIRHRSKDIPVTCSSQVMPIFREYERCSTTAMAAYVQPVISRYLQRFEQKLGEQGFTGRFSIMQSNGGRLPAEAMADNAITSLFSGPAAGVVGATRLAGRAGFTNLITLDMGGTSTDVCVVENGQPQLVSGTEVDGLPIRTPVIDIATVGAGGGSIIWLDDGGLLRVGPESAGADPGPAGYGRGGRQPTITDAHLVRGTVRSETFLEGQMPIDMDAARDAMAGIAEALNVSAEEAADAAVRVAESNIVRAIQQISTEKGKDPRDYVMVAFGGAGPMQAARIAEALGLERVLVPPHAGVLSALGLLASDFVRFASRTHRIVVTETNMPILQEVISTLASEIKDEFVRIGIQQPPKLSYALEMRYTTQAFEIPVLLDDELAERCCAKELAARFDQIHHSIFEFSEGELQDCEVVSIRVGGAAAPPPLPETLSRQIAADTVQEATIFEQGLSQKATVLRRGNSVSEGPAIVEDGTSTIFIPARWSGSIDPFGNLVLVYDGNAIPQ